MAELKYSITGSNNSSEYLTNTFNYTFSEVKQDENSKKPTITQKNIEYVFRTSTKVPKLGLLLVGLGGNNGTTVVGGVLANRHGITWQTKRGEFKPNFFGSITQSSTTKVGVMGNEEIYLPLKDILPMVDPTNLIIHGWDISDKNLAEAMRRGEVYDYDLQMKLYPYMENIVPMPGIYYQEWIAANQNNRADNILPGEDKWEHLETIRKNIRDFKSNNDLDKVIVLWTANTEKMCEVMEEHCSSSALIKAIQANSRNISPSTIYAVATILENCSFINGSPQNTIVPGVIELAEEKGVFVLGNDFKSGQTKFKTAFTDFLVQAGIKPKSIVSYNHLGNNDGKNLSSEEQFKSKEKSKSSCVDDILYSNSVLFKDRSDTIDHCIVIKYIPYTGDTKKALDEYQSEIFMGGQHTLSCYNVCEDSLLAAPIIIDLVILTELFERIEVRRKDQDFRRFDNVLDSLGYLLKQPLTKEGLPVINSLNRQKNCIENILKVCAGIPIDSNMLLERRV